MQQAAGAAGFLRKPVSKVLFIIPIHSVSNPEPTTTQQKIYDHCYG